MRQFMISTDTTSDLTKEYCEEHHVLLHPLHYILEGKEYGMELGELTLPEFYQSMRSGNMITTNATNLEYDEKIMTEAVENGYDIIHMGFSSAMSSSYNNAAVAAKAVLEEHPEAKIVVLDDLSATTGLAVLVRTAVEMQEAGKSFNETLAWCQENMAHSVIHFTVPDLYHLMRGGRLSRGSAVMGTMLKIQPILRVNDAGSLEPIKKVRGRKNALNTMADEVETLGLAGKVDKICISHGDCIEDAEYLAEELKKRFRAEVFISYLSPTLGAHAGPGTIVIGYLGSGR